MPVVQDFGGERNGRLRFRRSLFVELAQISYELGSARLESRRAQRQIVVIVAYRSLQQVSPRGRGTVCKALEDGGEMGLVLETNVSSDLHDRFAGGMKHLLGRSNALVEEIFMRPHSGRATKQCGEMHSAQSRGAGHIC
jgi:hypothetical protein